jgi:hypothetical protein
LQEVVLDAVEPMLQSVTPPAVALRLMAPVIEQFDTDVVRDGQRYDVFLTAELRPSARVMRVYKIGTVTKPA